MRMLPMGLNGEIEITVSQPIIDETMRVLREKFAWSQAALSDVATGNRREHQKVVAVETLQVVPDDPDDNRIVECAIAAESHYLITGDKHLLRLESHRGTPIMKASEFLRSWRLS